MLNDCIVAYHNVIEYSLVSTLRPSYEGYKVTLRPSYKGRKVSTSLKSGNHGLLIFLGGKQLTIYYHIIGIVEGNNFTEGSQVQF